MDENGTPFQQTTRMTTRGITRMQYAESPNTASAIDSSSLSLTSPVSASGEHEEQQSDYHIDTSSDSLFRTPSTTTHARKPRSVIDDAVITTPDGAASPSPAKRGRPRGGVVGGRGGRSGGARRSGLNAQEAADESSHFSMVKAGKNLNAIIDSWIEEYERHQDNALVQLQQFFISCCGCKGIISSVMIQTMEYSEIIRRMTEQFDEDSGDYPVVMPGPQWKKFKQNFALFITLLVNECKASYIFDQRLMGSVIQLLTGLADSQVRAFRHTSTFAAMKISSALVDVAIELVALKEKNTRQVETEKARGANERLDVLINKKSEIDEKTEDVRQMLQYIFKSVFVHRYRDVLPDTRSICINELGQWMQVYPEHFLEESFLQIHWVVLVR